MYEVPNRSIQFEQIEQIQFKGSRSVSSLPDVFEDALALGPSIQVLLQTL